MKKLLIVEDEKMIRQGIKAMVMRFQMPIDEIIECNNGLEALDVVKTQQIDVMITDIRMPKMDGITLVKEIKGLPYVPKVIVISGYDDFSYAVELLRNGAKEYLLKPIEREKLAEALEKINKEIEEEQIEEAREKEKKTKLAYKQLRFFLLEESDGNFEDLEPTIAEFLQEKSYFVFCTKHKKREIFERDWMAYLEDIHGQDVFIAAVDKNNEMNLKILNEDCFGRSKAHRSIYELKEAYCEAVASRKRAFLRGESEVECLIEGELVIEEVFNETEVTERMTQMIGTDKLEDAMGILERFRHKIEQGRISQKQFERTIAQLLYQLEETYKKVIELDKEAFVALKNEYQYETVNEYFEALKQCLETIHEQIIDEFEDYKNKQKVQEAVAYIKANYNKDLNMAVVSNYISMNYSLFSFVFKQYTGTNFVSYLKNIRVNEAKKLLVNTDKKIIEISAMVGYENEKHFMKMFKSIYGVSPSEYRKNMQMGNIEMFH